MPRFFALVPAAGLGRRMGTQKLALKLGSQTVLERVVASLQGASVDAVLVVLGASNQSLASLVPSPVRLLQLDFDTPDMRATVMLGIRHLEREIVISEQDALLLALGDQPTLHRDVVRGLMAEHRGDPSRIRMPTFQGKRGHPLLLPWRFLGDLENIPPDQGLNALVKRNENAISEMPVDDADVLEDLDDPGDLERHRQRNWQ
ncbi:MAG: nucleotidyltransferase family protein [Planctomycetota bacterium]